MQHRSDFSDETPIADALEQRQEATFEPAASSEPAASIQDPPPVEADTYDWQEQRQEVVGPDDDYDHYR